MNVNLQINEPRKRFRAFSDYSTSLSSTDGAITGLIVVIFNGEGRGVACRVSKPKEIK